MSDPGPEAARLTLREDPDGLLCTVVEGDLSDDMAREIAAACKGLSDSGREVLVLSDTRRIGTILPSARKVMASEMRAVRFDAIALFGASFAVRVVSTLAAKSVQILTQQSYPVQFFETEAEARAWLLAQRDALRGSRPRA
ncbi:MULTISPECIES: STAS/SEC14 domain-containing protein [unclassified Sorangium]|uniref:STAS/SEC14 domain-containing protein n=1 Tax=unclassified Sorangium TaxID=2621164 RepID=UPI003F6477F6